jgi:hypothetical protein
MKIYNHAHGLACLIRIGETNTFHNLRTHGEVELTDSQLSTYYEAGELVVGYNIPYIGDSVMVIIVTKILSVDGNWLKVAIKNGISNVNRFHLKILPTKRTNYIQ